MHAIDAQQTSGCMVDGIRVLWNLGLGFFFRILSLSDTKPRCLGAVLARIRTHGKSALCATKPVTSQANAPTNQVLLLPRLLLLLLHHLQQDHTRVLLPLSLRQPHGPPNLWLTLSTRGLLSQIPRLRLLHLGPLSQALPLHRPSHPPPNQSLQVCPFVLQPLRRVLLLHHRRNL